MNQIEQCKEDLIDAIIQSEDYSQFAEARERLKQNPEKEKNTNELRKRNFELYMQEPGGAYSKEMEGFFNEAKVLRRDPDIDQYLMAEQHICRMIQGICRDIVNQVELDLDLLD